MKKVLLIGSKNQEILAIPEIAKLIEEGAVVCFAKQETSNPDFTTLALIQKVEGIGSSNARVTGAQSLLLGWGNNASFERCLTNASAEIASKINIGDDIGAVLGQKVAIQISDSLTPSYPTQKPRMTRETVDKDSGEVTKPSEILVDEQTGQPVYRNKVLMLAEELEQTGHKLIKVVTASKFEESNEGTKVSQNVKKLIGTSV